MIALHKFCDSTQDIILTSQQKAAIRERLFASAIYPFTLHKPDNQSRATDENRNLYPYYFL